ncbi:hypothetical protein TWF506_004764 [Arthrobotrys conoides]|uniref:Uncharacterized protein n=1 Tax=Arthrobotrys conoides TaxID=74498 RepID=A0AAN8NB81_9PEZI
MGSHDMPCGVNSYASRIRSISEFVRPTADMGISRMHWQIPIVKVIIFCLSVRDVVGLVITVIPFGKDAPDIPNLTVCKPRTDGWAMDAIKNKSYNQGIDVIDPSKRICPDGVPGWHWELAPSMETPTGETLIQLTGGEDDSDIGGITNTLDPEKKLQFGILEPGKIFRSEFRVKRDGIYQKIDQNAPDDFIRVGDILDFYGPSDPKNRQLFLKRGSQIRVSEGVFQLVREPSEIVSYGKQPPVELRVASLGMTEPDTPPIEEVIELDTPKPRSRFCRIGTYCRAAASIFSRLLGGQPRQESPIEIPPLNMNDGPMSGWTDPFSSHRRLQPEFLSGPADTSILDQVGEDFDDESLEVEDFEPRIEVPQIRRPPIFERARLQPEDMEEILEEIEESSHYNNLGNTYTLAGDDVAGETVPANDISDDWPDEDIPDELLLPPLNIFTPGSYDQLPTPDFKARDFFMETNVEEAEGPAPHGQAGDDDAGPMAVPEPQVDLSPTVGLRPIPDIIPINLENMSESRRDLADRQYNTYAECIQDLFTLRNGLGDEEVQSLVDRNWGHYSILDFYRAAVGGTNPPTCPEDRQEIINLAIDQGHPRYVAPGTTGANPQSGIGAVEI